MNPIMVVQSGLRAPTNVKGGKDICFAPLHDAAKFVPILNLLKGHLLDRRACDNQTVKTLVADIVECFIKFKKMLGRRVFRGMRFDLYQLDVHLYGRVAKQAQQLRFRFNFLGHQIENRNF